MALFGSNWKWGRTDRRWGKISLVSAEMNDRLCKLEVIVEYLAEEAGIDLGDLMFDMIGSKTHDEAREKLAGRRSKA